MNHPPGDLMDQIGLLTSLRFVSRRVPVVVESLALRRPEIVVRRTRYLGVVVDERLLTVAFPARATPGRLLAYLLVGGSLHFGGGAPLCPGELLLLRPEHQARFCFRDSEIVELEWSTAATVEAPTRLFARANGASLAIAFDDPAMSQRQLFAAFLHTFGDAGAPIGGLSADGFAGGPSLRDRRIALAVAAQFDAIATHADVSAFGNLAGLSPRQLQRVYSAYCSTYSMDATSWRDTRNRWRVQLAAVLLSRRDLSQAEIAADVGYGSTPAMARAFARAGYPSPGEVRRRLMGLYEVGSFSDIAPDAPVRSLRDG